MATPPALLKPHTKDLGGFSVRRLLPGFPHKLVGPFIFFDHMGPADFAPGHGIDVRPHPHIGLATVTYLFDGAMMHRDSLGTVQRIEPGDVNWMTAGSGIVHSERSPDTERAGGHRLHGIQTWVALPAAREEDAPGFAHVPRARLPVITRPGVEMRLIVGTAFGETAPTPFYSPIFYLAAEIAPGATLLLPPEHEERAVYAVEGDLVVDGVPVPATHLAVLAPGGDAIIESPAGARVMLFGGAKLDGDRFIWWNFVSSSREKIEAAKARWLAQGFPPVPDETEFIPLPAQ
ncbi:MAG: pirin family protein [Burkholderiales bacterium]